MMQPEKNTYPRYDSLDKQIISLNYGNTYMKDYISDAFDIKMSPITNNANNELLCRARPREILVRTITDFPLHNEEMLHHVYLPNI